MPALSSITDVALTRTLGGISDAGSGGPTDNQIKAAIRFAQLRMLKLVTASDYSTVRDFTVGDLSVSANADKQQAYMNAESFLAIANLPLVLNNEKLKQTGLVNETQIGQTVQRFASLEEGAAVGEAWEALALAELAPYLPTDLDDDGEDDSVASDDGSFSFMTI